jgi:hypothetical protein
MYYGPLGTAIPIYLPSDQGKKMQQLPVTLFLLFLKEARIAQIIPRMVWLRGCSPTYHG